MVAWLLFATIGFSHAQNAGVQNDPTCPVNAFTIQGEATPKTNIPTSYRIMTEESWNEVKVNYILQWSDNQRISTNNQAVRELVFDDLGEYTILATVTADEDCVYELGLPIQAYATIYTYIWPPSDEITFAHQGIVDSGVVMKELIVGNEGLGAIDQQMDKVFTDNAYYIQHADSLLIDNGVLSSFLEHSWKLKQFLQVDLSKIDVYVFADISQSAFRRMTATYRDLVGIETMYVVEKKFMGSFLTPLLLGREVDQLDFVKLFSISLDDSNRLLPVSYLVDYLLQGWFPIDTLIIILLVSFLALVISFAAQVVWLNVFGVINPLLFGLALYILGPTLTIILWLAAFITMLITKRFTDRVYLLYSAKVSLIVIVYCVICLLLFGVERYLGYGWIDYTMFHAPLILFPFLFLILVGKTVLTEKFFVFGKWRWQGLVEFIVMSLIVYRGVQRTGLQNFLLWYPETLVIIFILTIVVGRFTGLQIFEYIRFFPLIKEYFEEEEE